MAVVENAKEQLLSSGSWAVDPVHSAIEFRVKHMVIQTVKGRFRDFEGAIVTGAEPTISGSIRVASLDTLHEERDAHLRSRDFFDVERHPEISFVASGLQFNGDERRFSLPGELTIKGITQPVALAGTISGPVEHADNSDRIGLTLATIIHRTQFRLNWKMPLPNGKQALANDVTLTAELYLARA